MEQGAEPDVEGSVRERAHQDVEGLDPATSYAVLERFSPDSIRGYRSEEELRYLVGTGVSAASIFQIWRPSSMRSSGSCGARRSGTCTSVFGQPGMPGCRR